MRLDFDRRDRRTFRGVKKKCLHGQGIWARGQCVVGARDR
jgi:hypothetical protein